MNSEPDDKKPQPDQPGRTVRLQAEPRGQGKPGRRLSDRDAAESLADLASALVEQTAFYKSIINNLNSGIIVTDPALQIIIANPYVDELFKMTADSTAGTPLKDLCPELAAQVAAGVHANEIVINPCGSDQVIGFKCSDLKNADNDTVGHIINFRELTDIVKFRAEMRQKERLEAMGEVIAGVAHEMRNPLFGMTSVGQILSMELNLSPAHKQLMDSFMNESRRLDRLVKDLLNGTRELRLRKKTVRIKEAIDSSVKDCQSSLLEKKIGLHRHHQDHALTLSADPDKLQQVLVNLLRNAVEACDPGGEIAIVQEADATSVSVTFIDSGKGIPENIQSRIFDIFFTTKKSGSGMGLAISKNIAEMHGGMLTAENVPGKGAKFNLKLPLTGAKP